MISFHDEESWVKFGQQTLDDPDIVVIDLRTCDSKEDFVLAIGHVLNAPFSTKQGLGSNLDALADVVSDYMNDNWLKWKHIYIVGWQHFIDKHPVFSQKVLNVLNKTYLTSIGCMLRSINWGDITFEEAQLLEAMTDSKPHMFLVLN